MKQELANTTESQSAIAHIVNLLQKPLLYGSLSEYTKRGVNKDGSIKMTKPYLIVSHGSETGTKSRQVPHGKEPEYLERRKNTEELMEAIRAHIRSVSQRCDEGSFSDMQKNALTRISTEDIPRALDDFAQLFQSN